VTHNVPPDQDLPTEVPDDLLADLPGYAPPEVTVVVARPYLLAALGFLALSLVLGLIAAVQLVFPDLFSGPLGYGRMAPAALDVFLYGWLTIGLGGILLFAIARLGRVEVAGERFAVISLGLLALGVVLGTAALVAGIGAGRPLLEYPLAVDGVVLLGMLGLAVTVTRTSSRSTGDLGPVGWYAVAASWWLVLVFVVGNLPGFGGAAGAIQAAFFRAGFTGLWLAAAGVAVVYFLIPRISARPPFVATRLSLLGFWSLAFVWPLTAPAALTYGPAPDWLETVGVVFSIALAVPVLVILTDFALAVRHRWQVASGDVTLPFLLLGAVLFALFPLVNLMLALHSSSAVIGLTDWVTASDVVLWYGALTLWLAAAVHRVLPEVSGRAASLSSVRLHYALTASGLVVWVFALLTAGVVAGWTWVANANAPEIPAAGEGWFNTAEALRWLGPVQLVGFAVYALGQLWFVGATLTGRPVEQAAPLVVGAPDVPPDAELLLDHDVPSGRVRAGAVLAFLFAVAFVAAVPVVEMELADPTLAADTGRLIAAGSVEERGLEIYVQEGCVACHTQDVRPIVTDVGLGPVSQPGDYAYDPLPLLGTVRIGPDLMRAGLREPTSDAAWVAAHLADPRAERPYSVMPSYDHLSDDDLDAVAAYVTTLR
jgi:cbb3-type cytochrome oxidase subunit 1/mono/diheme cytochrome c family protein